MAARRPGRCPATPGDVSFSSVIPSDTRSASPASRSANGAELLVREECHGVRLRARLPLEILLDPGRVHLRLAKRLLDVLLEPIGAQRPRADDGLQDQVRLVRVAPALEPRAARAPPTPPVAPPGTRAARARRRSASRRASSSRAGWRGKRAERSRLARWKSATERENRAGIAADLVEREEPVPAVEGGVLDALRVHGGVVCWKRTHERVVAALLEQQDPRPARAGAPPARSPAGRRPRRARRPARRTCGRRERRQRGGRESASSAGSRARSRAASSAKVVLASRTLPRGDLGEAARLARDLLVERRQRLLAGRIDEERADVVQELVPGRPLDRPVAAAARRARGSSRPRRARSRLRAAARDTGAGRRARRDGRSGARPQPLVCQLDHLRVRDLPHLGILIRTPASSPTSKKRRCEPVRQSRSKNLRAPERVAPERVLVRGGHVVRDDVEHDAEPGRAPPAERAELVLAPERLRDARRVDDVVAVRRALAGLERRREVEVRDAEVAQVGHERPARRSRGPARAGAGRCSAKAATPLSCGGATSERPSTGDDPASR